MVATFISVPTGNNSCEPKSGNDSVHLRGRIHAARHLRLNGLGRIGRHFHRQRANFLCLRRQDAELLAPKGSLKLYDIGEVLSLRQARSQVEARIDIAPGDVDDSPVERGSTLAGGVEGPLERRQGCIESIPRAIIGVAGLRYVLLGKGAHALRDGGVETEVTELICHVAIDGAGLVGGGLGIVDSGHETPLRVKAQAIFRRLESRGPRARMGLGVLKIFGKGGVHEVGTVVFTVSALVGVPVQ